MCHRRTVDLGDKGAKSRVGRGSSCSGDVAFDELMRWRGVDLIAGQPAIEPVGIGAPPGQVAVEADEVWLSKPQATASPTGPPPTEIAEVPGPIMAGLKEIYDRGADTVVGSAPAAEQAIATVAHRGRKVQFNSSDFDALGDRYRAVAQRNRNQIES